jgi:hypothetical protein
MTSDDIPGHSDYMYDSPNAMDSGSQMHDMVTHAHVEDFDFGGRTADRNLSEFEPHHDAPTPHNEDSAVAGGENPDLTDTSGNPLQAGQTYLMTAANYSIPDKITIDNIDGSKVTYTIHTDALDYQDVMDLKDIMTQGYQFQPDAGGDVPDADKAEDFAPDPEAEFGDDKGQPEVHPVRNVDQGATRAASVHTACPECDGEDRDTCDWCGPGDGVHTEKTKKEDKKAKQARMALASAQDDGLWGFLVDDTTEKTAGADFSPREQREFINESGTARNLERLDLSGTHYTTQDDLDDSFLLGM